MERTPFQTPRPFAPRLRCGSASIVDEAIDQLLQEENQTYQQKVLRANPARAMALEARASWQREYWATKAVMLSSGLTQAQAFTLASKVLGWNLYDLDRLSVRDLRIVREFFEEELG